jgi:hypothetical protein
MKTPFGRDLVKEFVARAQVCAQKAKAAAP